MKAQTLPVHRNEMRRMSLREGRKAGPPMAGYGPKDRTLCYNRVMNQIQEEIAKAIVQLSEKSILTEALVAKKIRENNGISGKNKAGLALADMEEAVMNVEENNDLHYEIHVNSANDLLLKPGEKARPLEGDARKRRQSSEKSISILTKGDIIKSSQGKNSASAKTYKKRTEKKKLNIYHEEEWD